MLLPIPSNSQMVMETERLFLEPVEISHAEEFWKLFSDNELHTYTPYKPLTLEKQTERCARWATRRSPNGDELWLNWGVRVKESGAFIGHMQAGVKDDLVATIGYVIARDHQKKGFALEAASSMINYLRKGLKVVEVRATILTPNKAPVVLAEKLGMKQTGFIAEDNDYIFTLRF